MKTRFIQFAALLLFAVSCLLTQPAFADSNDSNTDRNAKGKPIETATDSDLSDIPNLEKMDYDTFQEYFGDVPGDHVPLLNPDSPRMAQIKDKTPGSDRTINARGLVQQEQQKK